MISSDMSSREIPPVRSYSPTSLPFPQLSAPRPGKLALRRFWQGPYSQKLKHPLLLLLLLLRFFPLGFSDPVKTNPSQPLRPSLPFRKPTNPCSLLHFSFSPLSLLLSCIFLTRLQARPLPSFFCASLLERVDSEHRGLTLVGASLHETAASSPNASSQSGLKVSVFSLSFIS